MNTIEEKIDLDKNIYLVTNNIIKYNELENPTPESISLMWQKVKGLMKLDHKYFILINLTNAVLPTAEVREQIKTEQMTLASKIRHMAIYTGKNRLLNLAAKFVMGKGHIESVSISKNEKEALDEIKKHISK